MKNITLPQLLKAGVHFGHKNSRWNPKMKPFIYGHKNNIHIFDLEKTKTKLSLALEFASELASEGKQIIFIGTKKQAKDTIKEAADACQMPYVVERWLGGTFTNFKTVQKSMKKLEKLQKLEESSEIDAYTKKEQLLMSREKDKLNKLFAGIMSVKSLPGAIFVLSADYDDIAIKEANIVDVPVIAIVDSNADPKGVDYVIPGNDDSLQAIKLYSGLMAEAINEGKNKPKSSEEPVQKQQ